MSVYSNHKTDVQITFSNYNYAFTSFFENFRNLCQVMTEKKELYDLGEVRKMIHAFICEYEYTVGKEEKRAYYQNAIQQIRDDINNDEEARNIFKRDITLTPNAIKYYRKYYLYLLQYLKLFGKFAMELTNSYMPNLNIKTKIIRFSNNQMFFDKFTEHKKVVSSALAEFSIYDFRKTFNAILVFYYAYGLFIDKPEQETIDQVFSLILDAFLSQECILLITQASPSNEARRQIIEIETDIHKALLDVNSRMNKCFSAFDIIPKMQTKEFKDKTLI